MMHIGRYVAENNGLACESDWISIRDSHRYRLAVQCRSTGPRIRIFLKGFAYWPDQFSRVNNPASQRKEIYRAQLRPVNHHHWTTVMMDFTPTALANVDQKHPIQWLRIDFYIYLRAGDALFRQVRLKDISEK